jgi:hypothetical protein
MGALADTPAAEPVCAAAALAAEPPLPATAGDLANASAAAPSWAAALSAETLPLPVAVAMRDEALRLRHPGLDVVVFEVPQGDWIPGALPLASDPPADGLTLTGWDVIELVEPFWSPLAKPALDSANEPRNDAGLFETRAAAERFAQAYNAAHPDDEPLAAARIWVLTPR